MLKSQARRHFHLPLLFLLTGNDRFYWLVDKDVSNLYSKRLSVYLWVWIYSAALKPGALERPQHTSRTSRRTRGETWTVLAPASTSKSRTRGQSSTGGQLHHQSQEARVRFPVSGINPYWLPGVVVLTRQVARANLSFCACTGFSSRCNRIARHIRRATFFCRCL